MTNKQMRELEVQLAHAAITGVLVTWGIGWLHMSVEQRRGALALAILEYASGYSILSKCKWGNIKELNITAETCQEVLRICKGWSTRGDYGVDFRTT